jgi:peptidoglycan/LPS O-acetylase OafA/YrhL
MTNERIPTLDGLRAVSIALVILGHLGVSIFFVISGFLISSLLVREYEHCGIISLRKFYIRRLFRIFPGFRVGWADCTSAALT